MSARPVRIAGVALALALAGGWAAALAAPQSILPPGFENPAPTPTPTSRPSPGASPTGQPALIPGATSSPVVQDLPSAGGTGRSGGAPAPVIAGPLPSLPANLPSLAELESMSTDELDQLFGLRPKVDMPAAARRSMDAVGILAEEEGGLPAASLAGQPGALVRAALAGTDEPLVSRWGHILLRRALSSRLAAPEGMDPAEFAALRTRVLNTLGEHPAARALAQDVDTANYSPALTNAAIDAYVGSADIVGACPAVRLQTLDNRSEPRVRLLQGICNAFAGEGTRAQRDLRQAFSRRVAPPIDVLLAQRFAGAAAKSRRAVNIEWDTVTELNPWRFALATALGEEIPEKLRADAGPYYQRAWALSPAVPLALRATGAQRAAREGLLSSAAMVDLYSQIYTLDNPETPEGAVAVLLRRAYRAADPAVRVQAMRDIWGGEGVPAYERQVLTAYAAAQLVPSDALEEHAAPLIASMLTAGLDRDALAWAPIVSTGSEGWALLALAQPGGKISVPTGAISDFIGDDPSEAKRKSQFLVAALAGLGRIDEGARDDLADDLGISFGGRTRWTRAIEAAGATRNPALAAFLAGLGMQGDSWARMTPRHLYHIVRALNQAGLSAEARMIAAEAVARG